MAITYLSGNRIQGLSTDTLETPTYSTDFSSSTGWTSDNTAKAYIDTTAGNMKLSASANSISTTIYNDLTSISDTKFVLRFQLSISNLVKSTVAANAHWEFFTLSSTTGFINANQDSIGLILEQQNNSFKYTLFASDASRPDSATVTTNFSKTPTAETLYVEIKRISATEATITLYSDSSYSTVIESKTNTSIPSTTNSLRYFKTMLQTQTTNGVFEATADDLKFWNDVSSLTSKPTHVPANSRFEETDTRKIFYYDGSIVVSPDGLGSAADGTPYNGVTQNAAGKIGSYSFDFDGVNDYLQAGTNSNWNFLHDGTGGSLSFWVYLDSKPVNEDRNLVQTHGDNFNHKGVGVSLRRSSGSNGGFATAANTTSGSWTVVDVGSSAAAGQWYHVVMTTGGGSLKLYVDGTAYSTSFSPSYTGNSFQGLTLGRTDWLQTQNPYYFFDGKIDDLSVWSRTLSQSDVNIIRNSGTGRSIPDAISAGVSNVGLKAYYNFEQTSGNLTNKAKSSVWSQVTVY